MKKHWTKKEAAQLQNLTREMIKIHGLDQFNEMARACEQGMSLDAFLQRQKALTVRPPSWDDLWDRVRKGRFKLSLSELLDELQQCGITEGQIDGVIEMIGLLPYVEEDEDLNFTDTRG